MISDFSDLGFLSFPHGGGHENLLCTGLDVGSLASPVGNSS